MNNLNLLEHEIQTLRLNLGLSSQALEAIRADTDDLADCQLALDRCRVALTEAQRECVVALDEIPW